MKLQGSELKELFLDKPECVINLPEWLLSSQIIERLMKAQHLAIVEMAGRDSVAAAVKYAGDANVTDLLPTYVYTGTEHGPWKSVEEAVKRLSHSLPDVSVHDLLILGSAKFWQALNGRFISELISRFGFYSPCVGCHLYIHSVRIPLSITLGNIPILSGEREMHDGKIKINQTSGVLNLYQDLFNDFDIQLHFPLRNVEKGTEITDMLGFEWKEGKGQLGCVLSENYKTLDGNVDIQQEKIERFLKEFALPCTKRIVQAYVDGNIPDHTSVALEILENME